MKSLFSIQEKLFMAQDIILSYCVVECKKVLSKSHGEMVKFNNPLLLAPLFFFGQCLCKVSSNKAIDSLEINDSCSIKHVCKISMES